jgi:hypothetical protein
MRWVVNAQRRIGLNHLGLCRPTEKAAHGVKEMESLNWCRGAPITSSHNRGSGDVGEWLGACCLKDMQKYIIAFPARGGG